MTSKGSTLESIHDIIKCSICLNSAENPRFCPVCSALFCMHCINKWIQHNPTCPACRGKLNHDNLSSNLIVANILNELTKSQEYLQPDHCTSHHFDMIYYCNNCQESICPDCYLFQHKDHSIEKVSVIYNKNLEIIRVEEEALKKRQEELHELSSFIDSDTNQLYQNKREIEDVIDNVVGDMKTRLNNEFEQKYSIISSSQQRLNGELTHMDDMYEQLISHYKKSPGDFIQSSVQLTKNLQEVHKNSILEIYKPVNTDLTSEIAPPFEHRLLKLNGFLQAPKPFANRIEYYGTTWELTCGVDDDNLFINLKLLDTPVEAKYTYRFTIINQKSSHNKVYESSFPLHIGKSLLIPNYSTKDLLIEDGYLLPEKDILLLQFSFKPLNFCHLTNDLKYYITMLETQNSMLRRHQQHSHSHSHFSGGGSGSSSRLASSYDVDRSPGVITDEEYFGDDEKESAPKPQRPAKRSRRSPTASLYLNLKYSEDDDFDDFDEEQAVDQIDDDHDDDDDDDDEDDDESSTSSSSYSDDQQQSISGTESEELNVKPTYSYKSVYGYKRTGISSSGGSSGGNKSSSNSIGNSIGNSISNSISNSSSSSIINSNHLDLVNSSCQIDLDSIDIINNINGGNNNNSNNSSGGGNGDGNDDSDILNNDSIASQWDLQSQFNSLNLGGKWRYDYHRHNNNNNNESSDNNNNNNNSSRSKFNYLSEIDDSIRILDQSHENTENEMGYEEMEPIPPIIIPPTSPITKTKTSTSRAPRLPPRPQLLTSANIDDQVDDVEEDNNDQDEDEDDEDDQGDDEMPDHYDVSNEEVDNEDDNDDDEQQSHSDNADQDEDDEEIIYSEDNTHEDYDIEPFDSDVEFQPYNEDEEIYIDPTHLSIFNVSPTLVGHFKQQSSGSGSSNSPPSSSAPPQLNHSSTFPSTIPSIPSSPSSSNLSHHV
ncbi:hypothetical protein SAMD00019534_116540 [Acytostelium subglobosum LB1]|uniref:hypothetical protein n=1 Tax=Acytostelium subglobosum LB1 TaxID=1410327 RepID=UPI00064516BB|nr:hypothetical protein SAMD00019534_116540 [Acytostelium subglobosum LB1]GAM28478.1 hypothetical protein SAMD00019534_116540 [Acytostelium subglobosum LB1]|eukprot:XP_012748517.1 hypothetical protein SAMD00019534_116540 [Acytostelium subglobosum LB1]